MSEHAVGTWSRAGFSTYTCCDLQVNNMCEAFNSVIVDIREHVVISLVDGLKMYITDRIVKLRDYMLRYDGEICPMINKLLDKCKKEAEGWSPNWNGDRAGTVVLVAYKCKKEAEGTTSYKHHCTTTCCNQYQTTINLLEHCHQQTTCKQQCANYKQHWPKELCAKQLCEKQLCANCKATNSGGKHSHGA